MGNNELVIRDEVLPMAEKAKQIVVKNSSDRITAVNFGKDMKAFKEELEKRFHPTENRELAHKAWKRAKDTENAFYTPIDDAIDSLRSTIKKFDRDEALKAQRKAEEEEAKRREKERKERERLEEKAAREAEKGRLEKAEMLIEQAENVTIAPSFTTPPRAVKNLVTKVKVDNMMKLCKLIVNGNVPFTVISVNHAQLNSWAKTQDHKTKLDGLSFFQDTNSRI